MFIMFQYLIFVIQTTNYFCYFIYRKPQNEVHLNDLSFVIISIIIIMIIIAVALYLKA